MYKLGRFGYLDIPLYALRTSVGAHNARGRDTRSRRDLNKKLCIFAIYQGGTSFYERESLSRWGWSIHAEQWCTHTIYLNHRLGSLGCGWGWLGLGCVAGLGERLAAARLGCLGVALFKGGHHTRGCEWALKMVCARPPRSE